MDQSKSSKDIYLVAIGGTGMAPLACLLKQQGHNVRGVDLPLYPPMSQLLAEAGIVPLVGYDPAHLEEGPRPDLIVIGNAVPRTNPEVQGAERLAAAGVELLSMPQALARFFLASRRPLVVAGTHGKTTTSALAAWVLEACDRSPGYLIGGWPKNLDKSFAIGSGDRFVVEGDEYNAAYFDRQPKFLHYQPQTLILNSVEYDHADLYPDHESLLAAYRRLVGLVPADGLLVACGDSAELREVASFARCRTVFFGFAEDNDVRPQDLELLPEGSRFRVTAPGLAPTQVELAIPGEHNVLNALAVFVAVAADHVDPAVIAQALARFAGVRRRLDELGTARDITVVDDFAHHPTAVDKSLGGLRQRFPGRRLIALFEPRSLTAGRAFFFEPYLEAFAGADVVIFAPIFHSGRLKEEEKLDIAALVSGLEARGRVAFAATTHQEILERTLEVARPGDVVVTMSSGSFEGLPHRVLEALRAPSST
jgi:UDP-N-acetylmuramate: L-alanyl-gamma-D-glutamyl-meso-diaminopimelate ligase